MKLNVVECVVKRRRLRKRSIVVSTPIAEREASGAIIHAPSGAGQTSAVLLTTPSERLREVEQDL
jgi:hypothetical protein